MNQRQDEHEQCFIPSYLEVTISEPITDEQLYYPSINKLLEEAKQLQIRAKPSNLSARTCFLQLPFFRLRGELQQMCIEEQEQVKESNQFRAIENENNLPFQYYFQNYEIIYNKMRMYSRLQFQLQEITSRFKPISHLADFYQKLFKELKIKQEYNGKQCATYEGIFMWDNFDSCFQGGNLGIVYKKQDVLHRQYFLLLENDVNTHGYTSWFFFKVRSCGKGRVYFHILNLSKSLNLYLIGMKISIFSMKKFRVGGVRWFKGGENIRIYPTNFEKRCSDGGTYSCLYFQYEFGEGQQEVYFAMSRPYTYTMLGNRLESLQLSVGNSEIKCSIIKSIYSISCNIIPIVVFQSESSLPQNMIWIENTKIDRDKKILMFMGRQHPGEVIGSYIMDGIFKMIENQGIQMKYLMKYYTIVLIPMVNPDGVIHGNSRCNLAGLDLNRQWMRQTIKEVTPQTFYLRKFILELHQKIGIDYLIDFHGHSKKMNSFFFCNKYGERYPSQYLPCVASKLDKRFQFGYCTFGIGVDKKNSLRNQLLEIGMKNCITVENSYFGYWDDKSAKSYKQGDYQQIALSIVKSLYFMLTEEAVVLQSLSKGFAFCREDVFAQVRYNKEVSSKKLIKNLLTDDIQSESDPQGDIMIPEQMIKIYEKGSHVELKKKIRLGRNLKSIRYLKEKKFKNCGESNNDDDDRGSQLNRYRELKSGEKIHRSEKKLQTLINNNLTSKLLLEYSPKQRVVQIKKQQVKRQKDSIKNSNKNYIKKLKQQQIDYQKMQKYSLWWMNCEQYVKKHYKNNHQVFESVRIKTEGHEKVVVKKIVKNGNHYGQLKDQKLKLFFNDTLTIMKVKNNKMVNNKGNELNEHETFSRKKSPARTGISLSRVRGKSSSQIDIKKQSNEKADKMGTEHQQKQPRKKIISVNYKKELLKRKKILSIHDQVKNYRKLQNLLEVEHERNKKNQLKNSSSSGFYCFPVL